MALYIVLQTLIVYTFVGLILYIGSRKSSTSGNIRYVLLAIAIYAIVFGLRYGVGYDTNSYIESYDDYGKGNIDKDVEPGFLFINQFLYSLGLPSWFFLMVIAFLQLGLIYFAYRKDKNVYPFLSLTFMLGCIWLSYSNGLRQVLAFCFFVASIPFAREKKFIWHYLLIILAISMHKSAYLLLVMYPLIRIDKNWSPSKLVQFALLVGAIWLGHNSFFESLQHQFDQVALLSGYDVYTEVGYSEKVFSYDNSIGIGYIILLLVPVFLIGYSDYLKKNNRSVLFIYNLFFIGLLVKYAFEGSMLVQRVNYYFYGFEYIIAAFLLYQFKKDGRKREFWALAFLYCLVFIATLFRMFENSSAFFFIWQQSDYNQLIHH